MQEAAPEKPHMALRTVVGPVLLGTSSYLVQKPIYAM